CKIGSCALETWDKELKAQEAPTSAVVIATTWPKGWFCKLALLHPSSRVLWPNLAVGLSDLILLTRYIPLYNSIHSVRCCCCNSRNMTQIDDGSAFAKPRRPFRQIGAASRACTPRIALSNCEPHCQVQPTRHSHH